MTYADGRWNRAIPLDGIWEFAWLGDLELGSEAPDASLISSVEFNDHAIVPACFDTMPQYAGMRGVAIYRRSIPEAERGSAELINFDGVGIWAAIYQGTRLLHVHRKPYSSFTVALDAEGPRSITVVVDNRFETSRSPLQENYFDFYAYGGIFRPVVYLQLPPQHLARATVVTESVDPAVVRVDLATNDVCSGPLTIVIGGETHISETQAELSPSGASYRIELDGVEPWTPESPSLQEFRVEFAGDLWSDRFGLRTVRCKGDAILLNGEPVTLFGWNRHEGHPQFGPALPPVQMEQDIRLMKSAGANFVRGSHYPQDRRFLDLCDALGMLVWEESLGWQQNQRHFDDSDYQTLIREQQKEMIQAHANHPSIIIWGFQNELNSEVESARNVITALAHVTRETDPSRPVTFATRLFWSDVCLDLVDVVCINTYPGWYADDQEEYRPLHEVSERFDQMLKALEQKRLSNKPVIVSEIGAGAIYGFRDPHRGHWSEEYQRDELIEILKAFNERPGIAGLALWQFCDVRSYGSARAMTRPRGFNNKGILDEYRRPKLAWDAVRMRRSANSEA